MKLEQLMPRKSQEQKSQENDMQCPDVAGATTTTADERSQKRSQFSTPRVPRASAQGMQ